MNTPSFIPLPASAVSGIAAAVSALSARSAPSGIGADAGAASGEAASFGLALRAADRAQSQSTSPSASQSTSPSAPPSTSPSQPTASGRSSTPAQAGQDTQTADGDRSSTSPSTAKSDGLPADVGSAGGVAAGGASGRASTRPAAERGQAKASEGSDDEAGSAEGMKTPEELAAWLASLLPQAASDTARAVAGLGRLQAQQGRAARSGGSDEAEESAETPGDATAALLTLLAGPTAAPSITELESAGGRLAGESAQGPLPQAETEAALSQSATALPVDTVPAASDSPAAAATSGALPISTVLPASSGMSGLSRANPEGLPPLSSDAAQEAARRAGSDDASGSDKTKVSKAKAQASGHSGADAASDAAPAVRPGTDTQTQPRGADAATATVTPAPSGLQDVARPASLGTIQPAIAAQMNSHGAAGEAAAPVQTTVRAPIDVPGFVPAFSARIAVLVREGVDLARVHLNPAEMGPVAVQVSRDGQQVRVDLVAEQAGTRAVLEQALPALAGALREAGFTLSGGGVFQGGSSQGQAFDLFPGTGSGQGGANGQGEGRSSAHARAHPGQDEVSRSGLAAVHLREPVGLVDEFA